MNAIILSLGAGSCASCSNFFFRKGTGAVSPAAYLLCFYFISCLWSCFLNFPQLVQSWSWYVVAVGGIAGMLNVVMMFLTSKAFQKGPTGLTFAFQNASTIFPNLLLFILFGASFGFIVTPLQLLGMSLVLFGLYMASVGNTEKNAKLTPMWFVFAISCFLVQTIILTLFQWRCLLFTCDVNDHVLIPFVYTKADDAWFMPSFFAFAFCLQSIIFLCQRLKLQSRDFFYGAMGGIATGTSTYFTLWSTIEAGPHEKAIIFPLFAITVIVLCNLWGWKLYHEKINIKAHAICVSGILIASLA